MATRGSARSRSLSPAFSPTPSAAIAKAPARTALCEQYFYLFMSLLVAVIVGYGFSRTVGKVLIHRALPRPFVLYLHALVFSSWVLFFVFQSMLVRTHNVRLRRKTGWFGAGLGATMAVVGVWISITMARFDKIQLHARYADLSLLISLFDFAAFTIPFSLAIYWRKKPELHRRLILVATCALTGAAIGRFPIPPHIRPSVWFYSGEDLLIFLGVIRDLIVNRRVHPVYLYALPAFILCQIAVVYTIYHHLPYWLKIAHELLR